MATKQILVYHTTAVVRPPNYDAALFKRWSPNIKKISPIDKPFKYIIYTVFSHLRIFRNKNYFHYYFENNGGIASDFLTIPAYFRWPFMQRNSVQFTYVVTAEENKGKGLAWQGIYKAHHDLKMRGVENFWYVTDTDNTPSQRLAQKMGFDLVGTAQKQKAFFGLIKILCLDEAK